jgi:hypothetical protein
MARRNSWILQLLGCFPLLLVACGGAGLASPQRVFTDTVEAIRNQDPSLGSVRLRTLPDGDDRTGCGKAPDTTVLGMHCLKDRTVYTNPGTLQVLNERFGSGAVRYLAAHELAHGRQHAVTGFSSGLVWSSVVDELQADCIAGAYLRMAYGITSESSQTYAFRGRDSSPRASALLNP